MTPSIINSKQKKYSPINYIKFQIRKNQKNVVYIILIFITFSSFCVSFNFFELLTTNKIQHIFNTPTNSFQLSFFHIFWEKKIKNYLNSATYTLVVVVVFSFKLISEIMK